MTGYTPEQVYAAICRELWWVYEQNQTASPNDRRSYCAAFNDVCKKMNVFPMDDLYCAAMDYVQDRKNKYLAAERARGVRNDRPL